MIKTEIKWVYVNSHTRYSRSKSSMDGYAYVSFYLKSLTRT